ncbi:MAG: hypothetical protein U0L92_02435 [Clostridia bacterium]|nr:hypothetical protein [Clostridia bacterium]
MKKKKWFKSAICLAVGVVTLTAAVFANYDNANGYSVCKNALKQVLYKDNYSMHYKMEVALDGNSISSIEAEYKVNGGGNPKRYTSTVVNAYPDDGFYTESQIYQDGQIVSQSKSRNGDSYNVVYTDYNSAGTNDSLIGAMGDTGEKVINFLEALCDTFVGDLKNNFVLAQSQEGNRTYTIDLKGNQMPDVVTAGVSLLVQNMKTSMRYVEEDDDGGVDFMLYSSMFSGGEPYLDSVSGTMTVNADGLPTAAEGIATVFAVDADGKGHTLTFTIEGSASDYGTTVMEKLDLNSIPDLQYLNRMTVEVESENGTWE